jgi:hypothetical protein
MNMERVSVKRIAALLATLVAIGAAQSVGAPQTAVKPAEIKIASAPIPMRVLVQSPVATETELQIICLFRSSASAPLHGALAEADEKLSGLLDQLRKPSLFRGELGETLLLSPSGKLAAKQLLIIGLGDAESFSPERMELVGSILYREANRLGVAHPFFAPTVLDGGITKFTTGEVAEQVVRGFLRAARAEEVLKNAGAGNGPIVQDLTYLAGPAHATDTQQGMEKGVAAGMGK